MSIKGLVKRAITGAIFLIILVGSILYSPYTFTGIFFVVLVLANAEINRMISLPTVRPNILLSSILTKLTYLLPVGAMLGLFDYKWIMLLLVIILLIPIMELYRNRPNPMVNIAYSLLPAIYLALPLTLLVSLAWHGESFNPYPVLGMFIVIWVSDTGAYLFGTLFGKHKLFERISPKKTWEGSIGGGVAAILTATFILYRFIPLLSQWEWFMVSVLIVIFGTLGDLMESLLKRSVGVKDSGNLMPGHGGILDRFDSALTASVVFWLYMNIAT